MVEHAEVTDFKASHSFEERLSESSSVLSKSQGYCPVVIVKAENCAYSIPDKKYSVPATATISYLLFNLRRTLYLRKQDGLFLHLGKLALSPSTRVGALYQDFADEDCILYLVVTSQEDKGTC
jgi:hypothetical protein